MVIDNLISITRIKIIDNPISITRKNVTDSIISISRKKCFDSVYEFNDLHFFAVLVSRTNAMVSQKTISKRLQSWREALSNDNDNDQSLLPSPR